MERLGIKMFRGLPPKHSFKTHVWGLPSNKSLVIFFSGLARCLRQPAEPLRP